MAEKQHDLRDQIQSGMDELARLRDEIRLEVHLASLEAKDRWQELEPRVRDAEKLARDISETSRNALNEVIDTLRRFRESLSPATHRQAH